jgi:hypothetical protein
LVEDSFDFMFQVDVLPATPITQAHIHVGATGTNGPVIFFLCTDLDNAGPEGAIVPTCQDNTIDGVLEVNGSLTGGELIPRVDEGINDFADAVAAIRNGNTYVNVHTEQVPPGEIRGQLGRNVIVLRAAEAGPGIGVAEVGEDESWNFSGKANVAPAGEEGAFMIEAESSLGNVETRQLRLR